MIKELFYYVGKDNELTDTNIRNETEKTYLRHCRNVWTFDLEGEDVRPRRRGRSTSKERTFSPEEEDVRTQKPTASDVTTHLMLS